MVKHGIAIPGVAMGGAGFGSWSRLMVRDDIATAACAGAMETHDGAWQCREAKESCVGVEA